MSSVVQESRYFFKSVIKLNLNTHLQGGTQQRQGTTKPVMLVIYMGMVISPIATGKSETFMFVVHTRLDYLL